MAGLAGFEAAQAARGTAGDLRFFGRGRAGLFFWLCLILLLSHGEASAGDGAIARITAMRGEVKSRPPGNEKGSACHVGDTISVGDLLSTGKDSSAQLVMTDDSVINLSSFTGMRVDQYSFDPAGDSQGGRRTANVKVLEGMARFIVYKDLRESSFRVRTAQSLTIFSAADLVAQVYPDRTIVAVLRGGVSVRNVKPLVVGEVRLSDNQMTAVNATAPPAQPSVLTLQQRRSFLKDAKNF